MDSRGPISRFPDRQNGSYRLVHGALAKTCQIRYASTTKRKGVHGESGARAQWPATAGPSGRILSGATPRGRRLFTGGRFGRLDDVGKAWPRTQSARQAADSDRRAVVLRLDGSKVFLAGLWVVHRNRARSPHRTACDERPTEHGLYLSLISS
jgi:hypothetical protein